MSQVAATPKPPLAILAGGGSLPMEVAHAAHADDRQVLIVELADEAELDGLNPAITRDQIDWGQIGTLFKKMHAFGAQEVVTIGSIAKRPDHKNLRLDWGAVQMLPRLLSMLFAGGDSTVLDKLADILSDQGFTLVGAHEVAPSLVGQAGHLGGPKFSDLAREDAQQAAHGAWMSGHLDMGQGAVAISRRLVAMEGAEGTDGLLARVAVMAADKRFSIKPKSGALAKCTRPGQDLRMDMPTVGPRTIENAAASGLSAVVVEAERVLISQREETLAACKNKRIALLAEPRGFFVPPNQADVPA